MTGVAERCRVIVVDDEPAVGQTVAEVLGSLDVDVKVCAHSAAALLELRQRNVGILIADYRMPGLDGLSLIDRSAELSPDTVTILMTGQSDISEGSARAMREFLFGVLRKPLDEDELKSLVAAALLQHRRIKTGSPVPSSKRAGRILLLEDHDGDAKLFVTMAKRAGYSTVARTNTLTEALEEVRRGAIEAIVADLNLPDATGLDVVEALRLEGPEAPIVVLSGHDDEDTALRAIKVGAQDYLTKDRVDGESLGRALRYAQERKRVEIRMTRLACYDQLTGILNRAMFRDRLGVSLARARRNRTRIAVLFLDLDRFKSINDTLGHHAGDVLLCEVADRMQRTLRGHDAIARLGGDEFGVLLEDVKDEGQAAVERFMRALHAPVVIGDNEIPVSASIGVACFPLSGNTSEELLRAADLAMFESKTRGRNCYTVYSPDQHAGALPRFRMELELRNVVAKRGLNCHFQPIFELPSQRLCSAELLLRWKSKDGYVSPAEFIPILEDTGAIHEVGNWVLEQACRHLSDWRKDVPDFRIAVNLSARQFENVALIHILRSALERHDLPGEALELEITESALMQNTLHTEELLRDIRQLGCAISIDDFGTGYSSLAYLQRFRPDYVKIDRAFVADLGQDEGATRLCTTIIAMAHGLGIRTVGEGVETEQQLSILNEHGCDSVQGFLLGRPSAEFTPVQAEPNGRATPSCPLPRVLGGVR